MGVTGVIIQYRYCKEIAVFLISISLVMINSPTLQAWRLDIYDSAFQKNSFLAVADSVKTVQRMDLQGTSRFWYNYDAQFGSIFRAISSCYFWGYRLVNERFPETSIENFPYQIASNDRIFIFSNDEDTLEKANQSLALMGFKGKLINETKILRGRINYKISLIQASKLD